MPRPRRYAFHMTPHRVVRAIAAAAALTVCAVTAIAWLPVPVAATVVMVIASGLALVCLLPAPGAAPPSSIVAAARRIAAGEPGERLSIPSGGPERDIVTAFNTMIDELQGARLQVDKSRTAIEERAGQLQHEVTVRRNMETGLLAAIDAAEAADIAKSEFLTNVSHELRTPMTVIVSSTELLLDRATDPEQLEFLTIVKHASDTMLSLINNLIDYSRTERGELVLERQAFRLRAEVDACVGSFRDAAHTKGLSLESDVQARVPDHVIGDPERLRQILASLLDNAVKFTDGGSIRVDVRQHECTDKHLVVELSVRDTGIGIDPALHDLVFEPFTQVDGSSTRHHGGTGLGLALTRQLVEMMGGRVRVESAPGRGSTFHAVVRLGVAGHTGSAHPPIPGVETTAASR